MNAQGSSEQVVIVAEEVFAQVSPRSKGGTSLFDFDEPITTENVDAVRSDPKDIASATSELKRLGFNVLQQGETTISISGSPQLFQDAFGVKLRKQQAEILPGARAEFFSPAGKPAEQAMLQAPGELANLIEGVAIARPPELFESPLPPLAPPDPAAYRYLFLPDEVAVVIRAARAHRLGSTGGDVGVAMIDSGHYAHPFFSYRGYRVSSVVLGPGAVDPASDMVGHGTGESANIFAAAPDCRLLPIKGLVDPTGDYAVAVGMSPKPQVISNSWGFDVDNKSWADWKTSDPSFYAYLKTLEAAVADAIAKGIVVCFSAGNVGKRGFPASMPQVIAVGGVHVNYPNLNLEASSYASSFDSKLYPGRHVPDLCGLTGKKVAPGAPSHMLPVQPGSSLDTASTGAANDGWGLFSGTSAACPLVAGVIALLLEKNPAKTPAEIKSILTSSAIDVTTGSSAMGEAAGPGWDPATGAGLVDAKWAWLITMGDVAAQFFAASGEVQERMLQNGEMPRVTRQFADDMIEILRSR